MAVTAQCFSGFKYTKGYVFGKAKCRLDSSVKIAPEIRTYGATTLSRMNLSRYLGRDYI